MKTKSYTSYVIIVILAAVLGYGGFVFFKDLDGPELTLTPDTDRVSPTLEMSLKLEDPSGIRGVQISVRKNNASLQIIDKHFTAHNPVEVVSFSLKNSDLKDGAFELEIRATDASLAGFGRGNSRTKTIPMRFDSQPPRITIKNTQPPTVRRGGSGMLHYTANKEILRSGIYVGNNYFKGYPLKDGSHVCFFAFPHTFTVQNYVPEIFVEDTAGNTIRRRLSVRLLDRKFKQDKINVSDSFLDKVSEKMMELAPNAKTPLERYILINRDLRAANVKYLKEVGEASSSEMLWQGPFMQLPRSAARAGFADHRLYIYNSRQIDEQDHLGLDLASVRMAEIPAANSGRVVFTGQLGIYGNIVVIDHGMGVMSLYSHMTDFRVTDGATVKKGEIIGTTGSTGMAFGDHLHFGVLVGGIEVSPVEWMDAKWLGDNIINQLK